MAASIMYLGRIRGIERPTLVALLPLSGKLTALLDVGANADCKPEYLLQWAEMASAYMERVWKRASPRVGLLNIGEEAEKGSTLAQEAYAVAAKGSGINFIGNVEGRDVPGRVGGADIIVTDGFTGNVVVKTMEGMADYMIGEIKSAPLRAGRGTWPPAPRSSPPSGRSGRRPTTASTAPGRCSALTASCLSATGAPMRSR